MNAWGWWVVLAWLAGALLIALLETDWKRDELAALAVWPVVVPIGWTLRTVRRWRSRCPVCRRVYRDHAAMLRHLGAAGPEHDRSWRPPAPPVRRWP